MTMHQKLQICRRHAVGIGMIRPIRASNWHSVAWIELMVLLQLLLWLLPLPLPLFHAHDC